MLSSGIIGAGQIGRGMATALTRHGIHATLSNSRGRDSLKEIVADLGPTIEADSRESAAENEIVVVAVNWSKLGAALAAPWQLFWPCRHRRQQPDRGSHVRAP